MTVIWETNTAMVSLSQMQLTNNIWILPRRPGHIPLEISRTVWCGDDGRSRGDELQKQGCQKSVMEFSSNQSFVGVFSLFCEPSYWYEWNTVNELIISSRCIEKQPWLRELNNFQCPISHQVSLELMKTHWCSPSFQNHRVLSKSHYLSVLLHLENVFLRMRLVRWSGG